MPQNTDQFVESTVVYVPSDSEPGRTWMVVRGRYADDGTQLLPWYCNCPSFRFDARHYADEPGEPDCKHIDRVKESDRRNSQVA